MTEKMKIEVEQPFNQLTPAQAERLAILSEECGEVVQIIGKIFRHGYESYHPNAEFTSNRNLLEQECGDVRAAMIMLCGANDISKKATHDRADLKAARAGEYMHHQEETLASPEPNQEITSAQVTVNADDLLLSDGVMRSESKPDQETLVTKPLPDANIDKAPLSDRDKFPAKLRVRNTGIVHEQEGGIIFTTVGSGYAKQEYVRADLANSPPPDGQDEALLSMVSEASQGWEAGFNRVESENKRLKAEMDVMTERMEAMWAMFKNSSMPSAFFEELLMQFDKDGKYIRGTGDE